MAELLSFHWFNWQTVLATLGVTALMWYATRKIRQFIKHHGARIVDAAFRALNRVASRSLSARLSMRRYCISQLDDESGRYLYVPGLKGAALDVDAVFVPLTLELGGREETLSKT